MKHHLATETLLNTLGVSPLKRYGQNFLIHEPTALSMVQAARIQPNETILEIGPGLGALTQHIPFQTNPYISCEIDRTYHAFLTSTYPVNTTHILGNFIKKDAVQASVILGNLPYYVTTEILEKILRDYHGVRVAVLMVQKEVIHRIDAKVSTDSYGPLAIMVSLVSDFSFLQDVTKTHFYPEPHVVSSIFKLTMHDRYMKVDRQAFFYFIKKMFLHRRKTILNNLLPEINNREEGVSILKAAEIDENIRPEDIDLETFIRLFNKFNLVKSI